MLVLRRGELIPADTVDALLSFNPDDSMSSTTYLPDAGTADAIEAESLFHSFNFHSSNGFYKRKAVRHDFEDKALPWIRDFGPHRPAAKNGPSGGTLLFWPAHFYFD